MTEPYLFWFTFTPRRRYDAHMNKPSSGHWLHHAFSSQDGNWPWGTIVLSLLLAMLFFGLIWCSQLMLSATELVHQTTDIRQKTEMTVSSLNEAESAHRGYILSENERYRRQSLLAQYRAQETMEEVEKLVQDSPVQKQRVRVLLVHLNQRFELMDNVANRLSQKGFASAHALWKEQQSNPLPMQVRDEANQILMHEKSLLVQRQQYVNELTALVRVLALLSTLCAIAVAILTGVSYRARDRQRERVRQAALKTSHDLERALEETAQDHAAQEALSEFSSLLQGCTTLDEVFAVASHSISQILPQTSGTMYVLRSSRDHVEARADWGQPSARRATLLPDECWGLRQGRTFLTSGEGLCCPHREGIEGPSMCVPMIVQEGHLGFLFILPPPHWQGLALAESAAKQLGLAVSNLRLRETLRTQSLRDPLTNLSNRREVDEVLPKEIARSVRQKQPLSVLVMDIDHFKKINDTYGHDTGDQVLRELALVLSEDRRQEDVVARMGGEEFALILPSVNQEDAQRVAEKIMNRVRKMVVRHHSNVLTNMTVSVGLAECPSHAVNAHDLLSTADEALYRAKESGRNKVVLATGAFRVASSPPSSPLAGLSTPASPLLPLPKDGCLKL